MKDVKKRKEHRSKSSYKSESGYRSIYNMVRLMCDNVSDMIWAKDLDKKYIFAKKTEKALMESEQRLSYIINFLPDATFVINTEGRIIVWNK
jgi:PAS domain-containing protein